MSKRTPILAATLLALAAASASAPSPVALVICAPGYPGTTKEAQPSMDVLATAVSKAVGWPAGRLTAEYHETEDAGMARLKAQPPAIAMVPLPFFLAHANELKLTAVAQAVEKDGQPAVTWSLAAKKGRVTSASSLAGYQIVSLAAYAPDFIRNVALGKWGKLPGDVTFTATGQVLSALKKAANGDNVAVLLDAAQAKSLPTLPFAAELEIVATSPPVPGIVVCNVGTGLGPADTKQFVAGLLKTNRSPEGLLALDAVRLAKFVGQDAKGLAAARASYAPSAPSAPSAKPGVR
jgi:hypothetical protein